MIIKQQWAYQWKMEFNPDPTKQPTEVLFSCKKSSPNPPQIIFNGIAVAKIKDQKHLGLVLNSRLSFEKHLNEKIIKAKKNVGILKHLSKFLPLKTLDQIYKALVRSSLDYCDIIYHIPSHQNQTHSLMEKVERIQYQAALPCHFLALGVVQVVQSSTRNYGGKPYPIVSDPYVLRIISYFHVPTMQFSEQR